MTVVSLDFASCPSEGDHDPVPDKLSAMVDLCAITPSFSHRQPTDTFSLDPGACLRNDPDASKRLPMTQTAPGTVRPAADEEAAPAPNTMLRLRSVPTRYGFALLCTVISLAVTMTLLGMVQRSVFIFFWPAVVATAWFGGLGPALLCAFLSVTLVDYFIIPPPGFFGSREPAELLVAATFVGLAMLISWAVSLLESSRLEAALVAKKNIHLIRELEVQGIELTQQLEESQAMQEELEASTEELAERTGEAEAAERFTRGVLESISDPFVVQDDEWRFQYFNAAAERVFSESGMEKEQVTGSVVWDLFPQIVGTEVEKRMRQAFDSRTPTSFESYSPQTGSWSELFCYPLPDGGLGTQWKDITERKKSEEAARYLAKASEVLSSSLDYQTTLTELAHLVVPEFADWCTVAMANPDGGRPVELAVAHVDPEKVKWAEELNRQYPPPDDAPTGVPQVIRTGVPELYTEIPHELLEASARDAEHLEILRQLGLCSAMIVPISTASRTLGAITVVSAESGRRYTQSDLEFLTELARRAALAVDNANHHKAELAARQLAEAANEAKMQFLAVMSHELRTPLNAIGGYAELLLLGIRGPLTDDQTADLERIQRSQRNLLSLINDILNYAKLEAGHVVFDVSEVDLGSLLQEVEPLITPQLRAKNLEYSCAIAPEAISVWADAEKVRQILLNLLSNSIKFTEPGGSISIDCVVDGDNIVISVRDTGRGIAADKATAVFEPFVQLDRKLTSGHEGTGLGLAISRDLARGLGGELTLLSSRSTGSVFQLRLRRSPVQPS